MSVSADRIRIGIVKRGDFVRDLSIQGRVVAAISPKLYGPELSNQLKQEQSNLQRLTTRILMESKLDVLLVERGQFLQSAKTVLISQ